MSREVYFQLVDKATRLPLPDTFLDAVDLAENASVIRFRRAVWDQVKSILPSNVIAANLLVYANRAVYDEQNAQPLDEDSPIGALGASTEGALIVVVPPQRLVPRTVAPAAELMAIPSATVLNEPDKYAEECTSLTEWAINAVHEIPLIWKFMSSLGGCTSNGKIFWRLEDKQVASILVDGWFRESTDGNINVRTNKKSILMGSPGIGKRTVFFTWATKMARSCILLCRDAKHHVQSTYMKDSSANTAYPMCGCCWMD
ncbi:unnamed protein product [Phytophthora lilii]|uniref:Unnamed protein product n=1 Tax=Phytophthora lilii TaxID=2077276 RepID=A0A9W6YJR8_9STRA|nr:unnamed protein product [Phytophthora lilii]